MAVDDHFTTAGGQCDVILVLHEQAPTIRYMHNERMKRLLVEQFPDFVGFHGGILANRETAASFHSGLQSSCGGLSAWATASRFHKPATSFS